MLGGLGMRCFRKAEALLVSVEEEAKTGVGLKSSQFSSLGPLRFKLLPDSLLNIVSDLVGEQLCCLVQSTRQSSFCRSGVRSMSEADPLRDECDF